MKTLKKSLCIVLSFLMVFTTMVFFNPIKADAITVAEFRSGDYYYYPEGTKFISDIKIVQKRYGATTPYADGRVDTVNSIIADLSGYTILGVYDPGDGKTAMTGNLSQKKGDPKNWRMFTFLGYKTTENIEDAYATSLIARHEKISTETWAGSANGTGVDHIIIPNSVDLNLDMGGDYIFLYRSNDPSLGLPITAFKIYNQSNDIEGDKYDHFGAGYQPILKSNGEISDLKQGADDGHYIYIAYGDYGRYEKIPEAVMKALYTQIERGNAIGQANLDKFAAQDKAVYDTALEKFYAAAAIYDKFDNKYNAGTYRENDIVTATAELKEAIDALYIAVDYSALDAKIAEAEGYIQNGELYSNASIANLNSALNASAMTKKTFTLKTYSSATELITAAANEQTAINSNVTALENAMQSLATTIYFDASTNGGSTNAAPLTIACGKNTKVTVDLSGYTATKSRYDFVGWSTDPEATTGTTTQLTVDLGATIYAIFAVGKYTVVFNGNGATEGEVVTGTYEFDQSFTLPTGLFKKDGYRVLGWSKDPSATKQDWLNGAEVSNLANVSGETVDLYIVWTPFKYSVVFDGSGAEGSMANQSFTYDTAAKLTENAFTKEGGVFLGWATSAGGDVVYRDAEEVNILPTRNNDVITLYAVWDIAKYTVEYKGNGAEVGADYSQNVEYSTFFTLPSEETFKKTGYTLLGWSTDSNATEAEYEAGAEVKNLCSVDGDTITLYAVWEKASYTVEFVFADGTIDSATYAYGDTVVIPENTADDYDDNNHYTYEWPTVATTVTGNATYEEIKKGTAHDLTLVDSLEPTCTVAGYEKYACACGFEKETVLDATGHTYNAVVTNPTCTEQGYTTYTCSKADCDKGDKYTYVDNYVDALGHSPAAAVKEKEKAEDCGNDGYYEDVVYCSVCGEELSRTPVVVPATGNHQYGAGIVTDPTCTEPGGTKYVCSVCSHAKYEDEKPALGHAWAATTYSFSADGKTCTAERVCTRDSEHVETAEAVITSEQTKAPTCTEKGETTYTATFEEEWAETQTKTLADIAALEHDWNEVTYDFEEDGSACTAQRICKRDASHVEDATATVASEQTKAPTCTEKGETTYTATFTEEWAETQTMTLTDIDALGHTEAEAVKEKEVAPTCTEKGSYDSVVYCSVCDAELSRTTVTVNKLGHDWNETTYEFAEDGKSCTAQRVCKRDGEHVETTEAVVSAEITKDPTCTEGGTTTYTAMFAKDWAETQTTTRDDVAPRGHRDDKVIKENLIPATCSETGSYTAVINCAVCKIELSREPVVIPATGEHTPGETVKRDEVAPTCGTEGSYIAEVFCTVCEQKISEKTVTTLATGKHTPGEEEVIDNVAPTCGEDGSYKVIVECTVCEMELSRNTVKVPATGAHTAGETVIENEQAASCGKLGSYEEVVYCTICEKELSRVMIAVPSSGDHTEGEAVTENEVAPTCITAGSHDLVVYCTSCKLELSRTTVEVPATGIHTEGEAVKEYVVQPTCDEAGSYKMVTYCTVCNEFVEETEVLTEAALGHDLSVFVSSTEGTCQTLSTMTLKCSRCDVIKVEEGVFGNHSPKASQKENVVAATCTTEGSYDMVAHCRYCNEVLSTTHYTEPALAHSYTVKVDRNPGDCQHVSLTTYKCQYCEMTQTVEGQLGAHDKAERQENIVGATCTEKGSYDKVVYCTLCAEVLSTTKVTTAKLPHTQGEVVIENEIPATATESGSYQEVIYCEDCGAETIRVTIKVPATGSDTGSDDSDSDNSGSSSGSGMFSWWEKLLAFLRKLLSFFGIKID